jgi:hypothetical protein
MSNILLAHLVASSLSRHDIERERARGREEKKER